MPERLALAHAIVEELRKYDQALVDKPRWLVINKIDLLPEDERDQRVADLVDAYGAVEQHFAISAINGAGCRELCFAIMDYLDAQPAAEAMEDSDDAAADS